MIQLTDEYTIVILIDFTSENYGFYIEDFFYSYDEAIEVVNDLKKCGRVSRYVEEIKYSGGVEYGVDLITIKVSFYTNDLSDIEMTKLKKCVEEFGILQQ